MARLLTTGFEVGRVNTTALTTSEGEGVFYSGTPTLTATNARTGLGMSVTGTSLQYMRADFTAVLGRTYWMRCYLRRTANPVTNPFIPVEIATSGGATVAELRIPAGTTNLALHTASTATLRATATGAFPNDSAYHKIEMKFNIASAGDSTFEVWADNVSVISGTWPAGNTIWQQFYIGHNSSSSAGNGGIFDDVALNDDQGANQNGRCGDGAIYHLLPTALGAGGRAGWVDGGGGTTNLHESLNNVPPVGTAAGSNGTQIEHPTSVSGDSAEFDTQTYDAVVPTSDSITLVTGVWRVATSSLTGTNTGFARLFNNPDQGSDFTVDFEGSTAVAGTDPAGWRTYKAPYTYAPTVTRSAVAKLRITKDIATTRVHSCDYMAVQVESAPVADVLIQPPTASMTLSALGTQALQMPATPAELLVSALNPSHLMAVPESAGTLTLSALANSLTVAPVPVAELILAAALGGAQQIVTQVAPSGLLTMDAGTVTVAGDTVIQVPAAALITLNAGTHIVAASAPSDAGLITLSGADPFLLESVGSASALLTLSGANPALAESTTVPTATITLSAPDQQPQITISAPPASLGLSAADPSVLVGDVTVTSDSGTITLQVPTPTIIADQADLERNWMWLLTRKRRKW